MVAPAQRRYVFGVASRKSEAANKLAELSAWLGARAGVDLSPHVATSYEALGRMMREEALDVAWLPPIVFVHLEREGIAVPLVSNSRAGQTSYHAALVVRTKSRVHTLDGLRGARAAWVDPNSAAGYVLPRIQLVALGIDPRATFTEERFLGTHEAVVRAVMDESADVGATYVNVNDAGVAVRGGWSEVPGGADAVRVLASFGSIPGDLIAARTSLDANVSNALARAFVASCGDAVAGPLAREVLGVEECRVGGGDSYGALRRAIGEASERGLLDAAALRSGSMRP